MKHPQPPLAPAPPQPSLQQPKDLAEYRVTPDWSKRVEDGGPPPEDVIPGKLLLQERLRDNFARTKKCNNLGEWSRMKSSYINNLKRDRNVNKALQLFNDECLIMNSMHISNLISTCSTIVDGGSSVAGGQCDYGDIGKNVEWLKNDARYPAERAKRASCEIKDEEWNGTERSDDSIIALLFFVPS